MPPNRSRPSRNSIEQEGRILLAISAIRNHEISSIREAARRFNVPRSTLQERLSGHPNRSETRANGHKLTQLEEDGSGAWPSNIWCLAVEVAE